MAAGPSWSHVAPPAPGGDIPRTPGSSAHTLPSRNSDSCPPRPGKPPARWLENLWSATCIRAGVSCTTSCFASDPASEARCAKPDHISPTSSLPESRWTRPVSRASSSGCSREAHARPLTTDWPSRGPCPPPNRIFPTAGSIVVRSGYSFADTFLPPPVGGLPPSPTRGPAPPPRPDPRDAPRVARTLPRLATPRHSLRKMIRTRLRLPRGARPVNCPPCNRS